MKKAFKILLIALLISGSIVTAEKANAQAVSVSFSVFHNSLGNYGKWVNHGTYGQVWVSNIRGFRPYETGGHWAYTDYGWTWVSDYDWGWAPFHYGRWDYDPSLGWYWVPGYEWAPAWVAWRGGGDYYGWAPLSPGLNISVGISYGNQIPNDRWVFAPHRYITSRYINRYYVPRTRNVTIIKNTTIVNNVNYKNNVHYVAGPRREEVEKVNHTRVHTYAVSNSSKPGKTVVNKNTINVYRPVINKTVVNNNDKTVVNKNSNNTVAKNSNNKTVTNNSNYQTEKQNSSPEKTPTKKNKKHNKSINKKAPDSTQQNQQDNSQQNNNLQNKKDKRAAAKAANINKSKAAKRLQKNRQKNTPDSTAKKPGNQKK